MGEMRGATGVLLLPEPLAPLGSLPCAIPQNLDGHMHDARCRLTACQLAAGMMSLE